MEKTPRRSWVTVNINFIDKKRKKRPSPSLLIHALQVMFSIRQKKCQSTDLFPFHSVSNIPGGYQGDSSTQFGHPVRPSIPHHSILSFPSGCPPPFLTNYPPPLPPTASNYPHHNTKNI